MSGTEIEAALKAMGFSHAVMVNGYYWAPAGFAGELARHLAAALAARQGEGRTYWRVDVQRPDTGDEWHHAFDAGTLEQAKENKTLREHHFSLRGNVYRIVRVTETPERSAT